MKKKLRIVLLTLLFFAVIALTVIFIRGNNIAVLNPKGLIAMKQRDLIITATLLMLIVVIPVFILTLLFAWKYRESNKNAKYTPDWAHSYLAEFFWWGIPLIIIIFLAIITWRSSHDLNPFKPIESNKKALTIQVVALQWKWLFIYPEQGIATVNYIQFPEKTPVTFEITADAPMNSFWIPQLGGQIYAMPAMRTKLNLMADEVGSYRGLSANLSGTGFSGMTFTAKSSSKEDFDRWVQIVKQSSQHLGLDEYNLLVEPTANDPVASYLLMQNDLFDRIIMKYMTPPQ